MSGCIPHKTTYITNYPCLNLSEVKLIKEAWGLWCNLKCVFTDHRHLRGWRFNNILQPSFRSGGPTAQQMIFHASLSDGRMPLWWPSEKWYHTLFVICPVWTSYLLFIFVVATAIVIVHIMYLCMFVAKKPWNWNWNWLRIYHPQSKHHRLIPLRCLLNPLDLVIA